MKTLLFLLVAPPALAQDPPTAEELLSKIDEQLTYESRESDVTMVVVNARRAREFSMHTYGRGIDEAAIEYLSPAREKGTRMLRNGDELWMYLPRIERTQKISGHMLREGMMGSDVSYEDMMNNTHLAESYDATVTGSDEVDGRSCWTLEMIAKTEEVTYAKRVACIDKESYVPLRSQLYALSGMHLKTWTMSDIRQDPKSGRWVPYTMRIVDELQQGTYTEIRTDNVEFGADVPDEVFSTRWLERGS